MGAVLRAFGIPMWFCPGFAEKMGRKGVLPLRVVFKILPFKSFKGLHRMVLMLLIW